MQDLGRVVGLHDGGTRASTSIVEVKRYALHIGNLLVRSSVIRPTMNIHCSGHDGIMAKYRPPNKRTGVRVMIQQIFQSRIVIASLMTRVAADRWVPLTKNFSLLHRPHGSGAPLWILPFFSSCNSKTTTMAPLTQQQKSSKRKCSPLFSIAVLIPLSLFQIQTSTIVLDQTTPPSVGTNSDAPRLPAKDTHAIVQQQQRLNKNDTGTDEFNYTAYWQDAREAAFASLQREEQQASTFSKQPCPKVYVYNMSSVNALDSTRKPAGFGLEVELNPNDDASSFLQGYLYKTNQYAFPSILLERFAQNSSCVTENPNEADLFYVPILPAPKSVDMWKETCSKFSGEALVEALPFLNQKNACRHFLAVGKSHTDVVGCEGWFSHPIPPLRPVMRLAYSNYSFTRKSSKGAHFYNPNDTTNTTHPNLYSVPYPSNLHYAQHNNTLPQQLYETIRTKLMSFMGKDTHGDVEVRKMLSKTCKRYKSDCSYIKWRGRPDFILPKIRATFCLEPAGDTPGRKSLADSITFGCIPVLFSELTDDVAPWHWLDWKDRGRVLVPRQDFVDGHIDLKKLLTSIPDDLLELMKVTLRNKARQFQYSLDDDQEDGVRIILDNLHREALEKERQGHCGY